jgi:hypothetical protein
VSEGKLLDDGVETTWFAMLGDWRFDVVSRVRLIGEYEERTHRIVAPVEAVGKVELFEGSYAIPADAGAARVYLWAAAGYDHVELVTLENANLIHAKVRYQQAVGKLTAAETTTAVIAFASLRRPAKDEILRRGEELKSAWKAGAKT